MHGHELMPMGAFRPECGRMRLYKKDSEAPDYTPLADASKDSNAIMAELGQKQLDFAKEQYDDSLPMYRDLVAQQLQIADASKAQADDYYSYMKDNQRPVEAALNADAMASGTPAAQEAAAGKAMADARTGYTGALGTAVREGTRFGYSPEKMAATAGGTGLGYASMVASGANNARDTEKNLGYAKKMDVAGLYRGLPGASTGAYSVALNAGNSASGNKVAPGMQYQSGMAQGAGTIGQGRGMLQSGLQGMLGGQMQSAGLSQAADAQSAQSTGAAVGTVAAVAIAI